MSKVEKSSVYLKEPGPENTEEVLKAVIRRIEEGDIKTVVVASTSGNMGAKFAKSLQGKANVVVISHEKMKQELKEEIIKFGGKPIDETHLPLHKRGMDKVRNTFYTLGQGFKVAIEVILIAADKGVIKPYEDVIAVAGSGEGSDTAIVARATKTEEIFSKDKNKKLEVREIIAMPLKKSGGISFLLT